MIPGGPSIDAGRGSDVDEEVDNIDIAQERGFHTTTGRYRGLIEKARQAASKDDPDQSSTSSSSSSVDTSASNAASIDAGRGSDIDRNVDNIDIAQARGHETTGGRYQDVIDKAQEEASSDQGITEDTADELNVTEKQVADAAVNNTVAGSDSSGGGGGASAGNQQVIQAFDDRLDALRQAQQQIQRLMGLFGQGSTGGSSGISPVMVAGAAVVGLLVLVFGALAGRN